MIKLETKGKRWKEMSEDLAKRLANSEFITERDCSWMKSHKPNFNDIYGIRVINGTPSQVNIEGMSLQFTYDFTNYELNVWGTAQRYAGASYRVGKLVEMRELLTEWQNDWEKRLDDSK
ncbi:hypothetical protein CN604_24845 [Bacillus wiedmannii]|uniref:hypothetical protein n=1 Tax=Bacillus wiedmannii TaxID=1890302 RepID=UPI000BF004A5|nr:hypothetical protein [Bacillus wiedmannii]PEL95806.1 hypothetical protein CN604_24845 [Bacillus wiedmannii]